jgi:hypothetical protein
MGMAQEQIVPRTYPPASTGGLSDPKRVEIEKERHIEQTQMTALTLHWATSLLLIGVTSSLKPSYLFTAT